MTRLTTRRRFLVVSSAATGGLLLASTSGVASASAPAVPSAWALRTMNICQCSACHKHAANKVFASMADANAGRAHSGCRCVAVEITIAPTAYRRCFASRRRAVDRRDGAIGAILADSVTNDVTDDGPDDSGNRPVVAAAVAAIAVPAGPAAAPALVGPPPPDAVGSPALTHTATGRTQTSLAAGPLEWAPLPVAAALGLMVWFRNRRETE
jgi:hypothetical protein